MRLLCIALFAFGSAAFAAEDKKDPSKPTGNWVREAEGMNIRIGFTKDKDEVKFTAKTGESTLTVICSYEVTKAGTIKATVTDVKVKGEFPEPPKSGQEMTFKFVVDGKKAKLSDFESKDLAHAKAVVEGEYESKTD